MPKLHFVRNRFARQQARAATALVSAISVIAAPAWAQDPSATIKARPAPQVKQITPAAQPETAVVARLKPRCHADDAADAHEMERTEAGHETKPIERVENCDVSLVRDDKELGRMQAYVKEHVSPDAIVRTISLPDGDILDCVDMYKQPALRRPEMAGHKIELRPRTLDAEKTTVDRAARLRTPAAKAGDPDMSRTAGAARQVYGAESEMCPEKSVPIRRITMDVLQHFETLDDFFRKEAPHQKAGPTGKHQYAHADRNVANWGAQSILNVWSPYTEQAKEFSLSQIWVVRGSGSSRDTVEVGWQKYRNLYGDYRPRLFIYFTPDNYDDDGCYNLDCDAFVQVNNSVYIGGGFTNVSAHPHPSPTWEFRIRWQKDGTNGHWWLKYGDTWVGYYPRGLFPGSAGLRDQAAEVDFGGEITNYKKDGRHTRTDMGSGHSPGDGYGYAAYHRQIRYITTSNVWGTYPVLTESRSDSDCYDIAVNSSTGSWERYFYFGGGGYWAHCQ